MVSNRKTFLPKTRPLHCVFCFFLIFFFFFQFFFFFLFFLIFFNFFLFFVFFVFFFFSFFLIKFFSILSFCGKNLFSERPSAQRFAAGFQKERLQLRYNALSSSTSNRLVEAPITSPLTVSATSTTSSLVKLLNAPSGKCRPDIFPTLQFPGFCADGDQLEVLCQDREISASTKDCSHIEGNFCCYCNSKIKLSEN
jgi:hypothetical protein